MYKSDRSVTVAAAAASEAIVTTVTVVTDINTILRVPYKSFRAFMAAAAIYGVEVVDDALHGDVFVLLLYCNFITWRPPGGPYYSYANWRRDP